MNWDLGCCHCGEKPRNRYTSEIFHKKDCLVERVKVNRITLKQLAEMFLSLPENIQNKPIGYLDLAHMSPEDLKELKNKLLNPSPDDGDWICECQN